MSCKFKAILIDIDGTLLSHSSQLTERTISALQKAAKKGMKVILSTGRCVHGTLEPYKQLGIPNPIICFNGLIIFNPEKDQWLKVQLLPEKALVTLKKLARQFADFYFVSTRDAYHTVTVNSEAQDLIVSVVGNVSMVDDLSELPSEGIVKIQCFCEETKLKKISSLIDSSEFSKEIHQRTFPLQSIPALRDFPLSYLDLEPVNKGKAEAVDFVHSHFNIPSSQVIAIGDQVNDIPMLKAAGLGVAMGNANELAKEAANIVIGPNSDEGLACFIEKLLENG